MGIATDCMEALSKLESGEYGLEGLAYEMRTKLNSKYPAAGFYTEGNKLEKQAKKMHKRKGNISTGAVFDSSRTEQTECPF